MPEYLATVASAACLFPSENEFPDDALVALALRICGDDEAKLSAIAVRAAALADEDQRSAALGEVARRGAPGAAFDACAKAGVAPPAAVAASVLDPLERALADQRDAGAPLRAAARLATLDDVGATRRCLLLALRACRSPWRAIAEDPAVAALAPAAVLLAKPLPADVAGVLPELAVVRRQAFLNDGAEPRVADAAAAALLKAWAASKPDAAQAAAAGSALAESLDAGLLNVVAAYLPPRGDAVLGASAAAFAAEVLPRLAAKASTGDAALDKLATPLLIAAALTAPVSHERAALLADLLEAPLSALLKSDDGAGDVLVKVATGHVELFKDAVGRLSPSALADVRRAWGAPPRGRAAPQQPVSPAGGVRLDMVAAAGLNLCALFQLAEQRPRDRQNPRRRRVDREVRSGSPGRSVGSPRRQRSRRRCAGASAGAPPTARSPRPCPRAPPRPSRARRRSSRTPSAQQPRPRPSAGARRAAASAGAPAAARSQAASRRRRSRPRRRRVVIGGGRPHASAAALRRALRVAARRRAAVRPPQRRGRPRGDELVLLPREVERLLLAVVIPDRVLLAVEGLDLAGVPRRVVAPPDPDAPADDLVARPRGDGCWWRRRGRGDGRLLRALRRLPLACWRRRRRGSRRARGRPAAARERPHEVHRHPFLEIAIRILEIEGLTAVSDDEDERRVENVAAPEPRLDQSFDGEGRRAVAVAAFSRGLGGGRLDRLCCRLGVRGCRLGGRVAAAGSAAAAASPAAAGSASSSETVGVFSRRTAKPEDGRRMAPAGVDASARRGAAGGQRL